MLSKMNYGAIFCAVLLWGCGGGSDENVSGSGSLTPSDRSESFTIAVGDGTAQAYVEQSDSALPGGFRTRIQSYYDETFYFNSALRPASVLKFNHVDSLGTATSLSLYIAAPDDASFQLGRHIVATPGDGPVKAVYSAQRDSIERFRYWSRSGAVELIEYENNGGIVSGFYDLIVECAGTFFDCRSQDSIRISGEFTSHREENVQFTSVGNLDSPVDIGALPYAIHYPYWGSEGFRSIVSANTPSYYQVSVNPLDVYRFTMATESANLRLSVFDAPAFNSPVCTTETYFFIGTECLASTTGNTLYLSVSTISSGVSGTRFGLHGDLASFRAEGVVTPMDITDTTPYYGQVDGTASYYMYNVLPNSLYNIRVDYGNLDLEVSDTADFSNILCANYSCNVQTGAGTNVLYIRAAAGFSGPTSFVLYVARHDTPLYYIDVLPVDTGMHTNVWIYESDGKTNLPQRQYLSQNSSGVHVSVPLQSGQTYFLEVMDSRHGGVVIDQYAIRVGLNSYTSPVPLALDPVDVLTNEPNNLFVSATPLTLGSLMQGSFSSDNQDVDWYVITIP